MEEKCWTSFLESVFTRESHEEQNGVPCLVYAVKSQIFVRYFISYFRTFEKSAKFNTGWKFIFVLTPNFNVILFWDPRKYEN